MLTLNELRSSLDNPPPFFSKLSLVARELSAASLYLQTAYTARSVNSDFKGLGITKDNRKGVVPNQ
jgi:hypothetical protein